MRSLSPARAILSFAHSRSHEVRSLSPACAILLFAHSRSHTDFRCNRRYCGTGEKPGGIFTSLTQLMSKCRIELYVLSVLLHRSPCTAHQSNKTARFFHHPPVNFNSFAPHELQLINFIWHCRVRTLKVRSLLSSARARAVGGSPPHHPQQTATPFATPVKQTCR